MVAAHGQQADWVRNSNRDPDVRVVVNRRWRIGIALVLRGDELRVASMLTMLASCDCGSGRQRTFLHLVFCFARCTRRTVIRSVGQRIRRVGCPAKPSMARGSPKPRGDRAAISGCTRFAQRTAGRLGPRPPAGAQSNWRRSVDYSSRRPQGALVLVGDCCTVPCRRRMPAVHGQCSTWWLTADPPLRTSTARVAGSA